MNDISQWYTHEYSKDCFLSITNISTDDFSHGMLTIFMIILQFLNT